LKIRSNKKLGIIIGAIILIAFAYYLEGINPNNQLQLKRSAKLLQSQLHGYEQEGFSKLADSTFLLRCTRSEVSFDELTTLSEGPFQFLVYKGDSLVFWSSNTVMPHLPLSDYNSASNFIKLKNGYYDLIKRSYREKESGKVITGVGLLLIKNQFSIHNKYLINAFNDLFSIDPGMGISLKNEKDGVEIKSALSDEVFYIFNEKVDVIKAPNYWAISLFLLGALLLMVVLKNVADTLSEKKGPIWGFGFLLLSFVFLRLPWVTQYYLHDLTHMSIFNPQYYGSAAIANSLGDLLINTCLIIWLSYLVSYKIVFPPIRVIKRGYLLLLSTTLFFIGFIMLDLVIRTFDSIVIDSRMSFDVNSFQIINGFSLLGLLCLSFILIAFYLLSGKLVAIILSLDMEKKLRNYSLIIASLFFWIMHVMFYPSGQSGWYDPVILFATIWGIVSFKLLTVKPLTKKVFPGYTSLGAWIALFAVFATFLLHHSMEKKEQDNRLHMAERLSTEKDPVFEYIFDDIQKNIENDNFVISYFLEPLIPKTLLEEKLTTLYFGGYLNRYDIAIYTFDSVGCFLKGEPVLDDISHFDNMIVDHGESTLNRNLFRVEDHSGKSKYLARLAISKSNVHLGTMIIELNHRTYRQTNVYPELLLEEKIRATTITNKYDYAIYEYQHLVNKSGSFPYSFEEKEWTERAQESGFITDEDFSHFIYTPNPHKLIVVTKKKDSLFKPVSLFSYLFCLFLVVVLFVWIIRGLAEMYKSKQFGIRPNLLTFQSKIHFAMFFIIIFSFMVIGSVTIIYFQSQFDIYHQQRLMRKVKAVSSAIEYIISEESVMDWPEFEINVISEKVNESQIIILSDIHSVDINVYDQKGALALSSQPKIFDRGLIATKMSPSAFYNLTMAGLTGFVQNEEIGHLQYLSAYVPIRSVDGAAIGYLNLPYFAKEKNLRKDIGAFLVALINVYVLLLIGGGLLVFFISNSITKSLRVIGEKLKVVTLGKKIKPIDWVADDEIGMLVGEYNKMILQLEKSADLLARSERESAWREMAKQVAHEIKNPLTPMKLSIQHLQKAYLEDDVDIKEKAEKVTATLIEQIENLSHIATGFSSFAKMPKPKSEKINLNDILNSEVQLFSDEQKIDFQIDLPKNPAYVIADKNQMLSVFNNFIKNAIQAIPNDRKGKVEVVLKENKKTFVITITDNGIGIPEDKREKVFVPNFTTKSSGMGLGLALTKSIIEFANGRIWFESTLNEGSTFFVELPKEEL